MADRRIWMVGEFASKLQHCRIRCQACGRTVILPPKLAVATFGGLTLVGTLERRLRCEGCGEKRARVSGVYREWHG